MARKRTRYNDDFRASAVLMLEAQGYPEKPGALAIVAARLGVPHQTLSRWGRAVNNPAPPELVQEKKIDLIEMFRAEIRAALHEANEARGDASYRDLMTGIGILTDKLQLLEGKPTEAFRVTHDYDGAIDELARRLGAPATNGRDKAVPPRELVQ